MLLRQSAVMATFAAQTERRALLGSGGFNFSTPSNARRSKIYHCPTLTILDTTKVCVLKMASHYKQWFYALPQVRLSG
jgi:hypothetical protein